MTGSGATTARLTPRSKGLLGSQERSHPWLRRSLKKAKAAKLPTFELTPINLDTGGTYLPCYILKMAHGGQYAAWYVDSLEMANEVVAKAMTDKGLG